ncbi:hypothetical protein SAMN04489729_7060 [Amycolatopsis lurida]|uniref:Uncharacterized protein n=1 Tax=Amycolatopsis lurida NRRL 2430 TaxID=1460371 RepID=A0A2P2FFC7_AMYLU|nr:hypothetical protein [Amycolatopsis lurida]KFU75423.1 hypothetical protein BB31_41565 [Amycolatopsis lurida NRRL 2430]SEE31559.1 hypothetical protein SAMN04489729_7060 [Amycolatopsis lurida]
MSPLTFHPAGVPSGLTGRPDAQFGFELEFQVIGEDFVDVNAVLRAKLDEAGFGDWAVVEEGAHDYGVEVISPILPGAAKSWANLAAVLEIICSYRGVDGASAQADHVGGHVNFSFEEQLEPPVYGRVAQLNMAFESLLYRLGNHYGATALQRDLWAVGPNPIPPPAREIVSIDEVQALSTSKYDAINFQYVDGDASDWLEFRFWAGSLDPAVWQVHAEISAAMVLAAKDPSLYRRLDELMADPRLLGHEPETGTNETELGRLLDFLALLPLSPAAQKLAVALYAWTSPWTDQGANDHQLRAQTVIGPGARGWIFPTRGDSVPDVLQISGKLQEYAGAEIVVATASPGRRTVEMWRRDPVPFAGFAKVLAARGVTGNAADEAKHAGFEARLVLAVSGGAARLGLAVMAEVSVPTVVTHGRVQVTEDGRIESDSEWIELRPGGEQPLRTGVTDLRQALDQVWAHAAPKPQAAAPGPSAAWPGFGGTPFLTLAGAGAPASPGVAVPSDQVSSDNVNWSWR